jgi:hypothetical protein
MTELVLPIKRQASHIFRSYNYQAYQTILAWLSCGENEEILTEFVEEVDLVRRDAQGKITDAELTRYFYEDFNPESNSVNMPMEYLISPLLCKIMLCTKNIQNSFWAIRP